MNLLSDGRARPGIRTTWWELLAWLPWLLAVAVAWLLIVALTYLVWLA